MNPGDGGTGGVTNPGDGGHFVKTGDGGGTGGVTNPGDGGGTGGVTTGDGGGINFSWLGLTKCLCLQEIGMKPQI